jgi:predicted ATPase with chaperone activity
MTHTGILTRGEVETMGPPALEEIADADVPASFLCDLALKHVAYTPEPTTVSVAEEMRLPRSLVEELLVHLSREKLIEVKMQAAVGATRYAMLERGWERVTRVQSLCGYVGPAPVSLRDYSHMMRLQAVPARPATPDTVRAAFRDLVLPESLLQTLGCVVNSRRSLFVTGPPGTGKTAVAERINAGLPGYIWIPFAIEIDGQIVRVFDNHNHRPVSRDETPVEYDRRWVCIERPLVIVGGELTLDDADLQWSEAARFYEAPFQMKSNGGTLVIDDFGRQRVAPQDLLNRWIVPLEKRVDYLTLHTGKKIEVPFEQLVVFSTNLDERDLVDEAFLRRMGYRARVEPPTPAAYSEIFRRAANARGIRVEQSVLDYILNNYMIERRQMKACEPRDLLDRVTDICLYEGHAPELSTKLVDGAWRNYFGTSHSFTASELNKKTTQELNDANPLQL